jgi:hypothetical protein
MTKIYLKNLEKKKHNRMADIKPKYKIKSITKGKVIPASVIEERSNKKSFKLKNNKNNNNYFNSNRNAIQKDPSLSSHLEKIQKCLVKLNLFGACFACLESDLSYNNKTSSNDKYQAYLAQEKSSRPSFIANNFELKDNQKLDQITTINNRSQAQNVKSPSQKKKHSKILSSSPFNQKLNKSTSLIDEIGLRTFSTDLKSKELSNINSFNKKIDKNKIIFKEINDSPVSRSCMNCMLVNQNNPIQYLEDIYECPECSEIYLDVNNNYKRASKCSLDFQLFEKFNERLKQTNNLESTESKSLDTFDSFSAMDYMKKRTSRVTFASLFGGETNIFEETEENENSEIITEKESTGLSNLQTNRTRRKSSNSDEYFETQSFALDLNTESEYSGQIYETEVFYI